MNYFIERLRASQTEATFTLVTGQAITGKVSTEPFLDGCYVGDHSFIAFRHVVAVMPLP